MFPCHCHTLLMLYHLMHDTIHTHTGHHHAKAAARTPLSPNPPHGLSTISGFSLTSGSQSGITSTSNRGILLATIPQLTSIESFKATSLRVSAVVVYNHDSDHCSPVAKMNMCTVFQHTFMFPCESLSHGNWSLTVDIMNGWSCGSWFRGSWSHCTASYIGTHPSALQSLWHCLSVLSCSLLLLRPLNLVTEAHIQKPQLAFHSYDLYVL